MRSWGMAALRKPVFWFWVEFEMCIRIVLSDSEYWKSVMVEFEIMSRFLPVEVVNSWNMPIRGWLSLLFESRMWAVSPIPSLFRSGPV